MLLYKSTLLLGDTGRLTTCIEACYELGGGVLKTMVLNIHSVCAGPPPAAPSGTQPDNTTTTTATTTNTTNTSSNNSQTVTNVTTNITTVAPTAEMAETVEPAPEESKTEDEEAKMDEEKNEELPPTTEAHGYKWNEDDPYLKLPINGLATAQEWYMRSAVGDLVGAGMDVQETMSCLDYFLMMMPPKQIQLSVELTNEKLLEKYSREITCGELIQFFGIMLLVCKFEFTEQSLLWSMTAPSKYTLAPSFGRTGMSCNHFDTIWSALTFGRQPKLCPPTMSSEHYHWKLVDVFIENFNKHCQDCFVPSNLILVDESISRWYGQGGFWVNEGLHQYVVIDWKPENGCEIQNAACGWSGVMIQLKLVKTKEEEDSHLQQEHEGLLHGTVVLRNLVETWAFSQRIVCADSYFASVGAVKELRRMGL